MRRSPKRDPVLLLATVLASVIVATPAAWSFCGFFAGVSTAGMENSDTQTVLAHVLAIRSFGIRLVLCHT